MAQLIPLDPVVKVPIGDLELHALDAARTDNGLRVTVHLMNGTAQGGDVVDLNKQKARQSFVEHLCRIHAVSHDAANQALIELGRQVEVQLRQEDAQDEESEDAKQPAAQRLVGYAKEADLFMSDREEAFAAFTVNNIRKIYGVRTGAFRDWLYKRFYDETGKTPNAQAFADARCTIESLCRYGDVVWPLGVRVTSCPAEPNAVLYDMADGPWRAIKITPAGWQMLDQPPVAFRRYNGYLPQSEPERGGTLDELRPFLNVKDDDAWKLVVAWLVAAFIPEIAHPILITHGEQGSAKSSYNRLLGMLIHPSLTPLRSEPRDKSEWILAADHHWYICLDNVSHLPGWLSDSLCRAVTGDGDSKRKLYTDDDDHIFTFRRVIAMTGIAAAAQNADVLDRAILNELLPIPEDKRRPESEVFAQFEKARPRIFAALLDCVSGVLRELPSVRLDRHPRMADFARVGVAVERVLGWPAGSFMKAYGGNIGQQNEEAISASPIGDTLVAFMDEQKAGWSGTPSELLSALAALLEQHKQQPPRDWPRQPNKLTEHLKRLTPNLRKVGIDIELGRTGRRRLVTLTRRVVEGPSPSSQPSQDPYSERGTGSHTVTVPVTINPANDGLSSPTVTDSDLFHAQSDDGDGSDGHLPYSSANTDEEEDSWPDDPFAEGDDDD